MRIPPLEDAALVQGFLMDVVAGGDTDAVAVYLADDVAEYDPVFGGRRGGVAVRGWQPPAAVEVDVEIEDGVATDDSVAVRATVSGTHRGSLMHLAPAGASFDILYSWFCDIEDRRIAESWSLPEGLGLRRPVGALSERAVDAPATDPTD